MKKLRNTLLGIMALGAAATAFSMVVKYNGYLVNETGLAYSKNIVLPLNQYQVDSLAFTSIASSVTFANTTFTDGSRSTGTITVTSTAALVSVAAFDSLTVGTTTIPSTGTLTLNGYTFYLTNYADITTTATAINLSADINRTVPNVITATTSAGSVISATATVKGTGGNAMLFSTTVSTNVISFSTYLSSSSGGATSQFSGGVDTTAVSINGIQIIYTPVLGAGGSTTTATNIANAINANSLLNSIVIATNNTNGSVVIATSTVVGLGTNYVMASSSSTALTLSGPKTIFSNGSSTAVMTGGLDASYALVNTSATVINIANHGYTSGLKVLYTTGTTTIGITGLVNGTTYFVIPVTPNSISLASSLSNAVSTNTVPIVLSSSRTAVGSATFTLTPAPIAGTVSYRWEVSNDGMTWQTYTANNNGTTIPSVSLGSYVSTGTITAWDMGEVNYAFIRLAIVGPSAGAVRIQVSGNGKNSSQ